MKFCEICQKFSIKVTTKPAGNPWSNGLCKRQNQRLTNMLDKILGDTKLLKIWLWDAATRRVL